MGKVLAALAFALLFYAPSVPAQDGPQGGGHELQVWTGGGHGLTGSTSDTGVWNLGLRYGWILTGPVGPGPLRGNFEYAVDVVPAFVVAQKHNNAYGFGIDPIALKWNFATHGRVKPYAELCGGTLFTNNNVPAGTSTVNFTTSGAVGAHFLVGKFAWSADVRFMHISNAGLATPNPGINSIQFRLGFGLFTHHK